MDVQNGQPNPFSSLTFLLERYHYLSSSDKVQKYWRLAFGNEFSMTDVFLSFLLSPWVCFLLLTIVSILLLFLGLYLGMLINRYLKTQQAMAEAQIRIAQHLDRLARNQGTVSMMNDKNVSFSDVPEIRIDSAPEKAGLQRDHSWHKWKSFDSEGNP